MAEGVARVAGTPNDAISSSAPSTEDMMSDASKKLGDLLDRMKTSKIDPIEMVFNHMLSLGDDSEAVSDFVQRVNGMLLSPNTFGKLQPKAREGFIEGMGKLPDERYRKLFPSFVQPTHSGNNYTSEDIQKMLTPFLDQHRIMLGQGR